MYLPTLEEFAHNYACAGTGWDGNKCPYRASTVHPTTGLPVCGHHRTGGSLRQTT